MAAPDDNERLSINIRKDIVKPPRPKSDPLPISRPAPVDLTEERRTAPIRHLLKAEPTAAPQSGAIRSGKAPTDDLLRRCRQHMQRATYPKTARDLVGLWYADWRGRKDKPKNISKKYEAGHVDRVSKWLERHERAGRLRVVDHKGKWNTKRYLQVDEADWRRTSNTKGPKASEISSEP
jgi:hypothetical protein